MLRESMPKGWCVVPAVDNSRSSKYRLLNGRLHARHQSSGGRSSEFSIEGMTQTTPCSAKPLRDAHRAEHLEHHSHDSRALASPEPASATAR